MKSLFDLSFNRFIAPTVAKIVYVLVMVVIGLVYVIAVIGSFQQNALLGVFVLLILGPLVALLYLVLVRIGLESLLASIKTAQNTAELVRLSGGNPGHGGFSASYGQGPLPSSYPGGPAGPPSI